MISVFKFLKFIKVQNQYYHEQFSQCHAEILNYANDMLDMNVDVAAGNLRVAITIVCELNDSMNQASVQLALDFHDIFFKSAFM